MNKLDSQRLYLAEIIDKSRSRLRAKYSEDRIAKVIEKIVSADNIDSICVDIAESIVEIVNKRIKSDESMKAFRSDISRAVGNIVNIPNSVSGSLGALREIADWIQAEPDRVQSISVSAESPNAGVPLDMSGRTSVTLPDGTIHVSVDTSDIADSSISTVSLLDINDYTITASPISRNIDLENTPENRAQIDRIIEDYLSRREMS